MSTGNTNAQQTTQASSTQKTRSIGHYIFGKTLGEGTFGKVKVATHILTGEKVAIKILEKSKIFDVSDVERVSREIHILKMIRHPHLIQLYEIIETPKQLFLVMEFANGGELFDYIVQNQRIKDLEAARFFNQIVAGIEYVHKLNIVHRDMKPENLLLDTKNRIKIVDFGLSNIYKKDELLKTACGSPCYAAPEMIAGKKYNGLQVDIWSCGVILFAMLCGYLPFEDPNTSALYKKILAGDYKIPKFVSPEGRDLIKGILTTDPTKRFTVEEIRKHPWFNLYRQSKVPQGLIMGTNKVPVDTLLLGSLQAYGFNLEYAQKCIEGNRHNHVTTTYYLLLKKHVANGGKSIGDIGSDKFEPDLLEQPKQTSKPLILVQNQSYQKESKPGKVESTGGSSSKDRPDLENHVLARSQVNSLQTQQDYRTQERKQSLSINDTAIVKPQSRQNTTANNTSLNTSLNHQVGRDVTPNQFVSNPKVRGTETSEKRSAYRQRRAQNSVYTQNNSIMNSPRESTAKPPENHSADNTRRTTAAVGNQFMTNLNSILNNPIDQPLFKTTQLSRNEKKPAQNFNTTGQMNDQTEVTHKNNNIYRQNLHLVADTQTNFLQQLYLKATQQRPRGVSQNEGQSRMQRRLIIGRDSRGKSTEPMEEADNSELKVISVLDTSGYSNQGRTFYKSSRASPVIDTPNSRQYVIPYHLKFNKENPTLVNWRRKE